MRLRKFTLLVSCLLMSLCSGGTEPGRASVKAGAHPPQPAPGADSWSEFLALSVLQVPPPHSEDEKLPQGCF